MSFRPVVVALALACAACPGAVPRYPDDVQASLAHADMRRFETDHLIVYYPANRRAVMERFVLHAERCADALRDAAQVKTGAWNDKMVVVMPDVPYNNAFVTPDLAGYEAAALIPTTNTLDLSTEFGLPPDPGFIACHELTHYVHDKQISGLWHYANLVLGAAYDPQIGYDPWMFEGLAVHYETALNPGVGRARWPIFTGMFAAGYAGQHVGGGEMSEFKRLASVGHHYLVGTMFIRFLSETYGEASLWKAIAAQAHAAEGLFFTGSFKKGFGTSFHTLLDEFDAWCGKTFPVRAVPAGQNQLAALGEDARYARGRDGTEAWIAEDMDAAPHLVVRDARGNELADVGLIDVAPPRKLVEAAPLLVSGLSVTADGQAVWFTVIDAGATEQVTRLVRWTKRGGIDIVASGLGPGATIDPTGRVYYYCAVDGDRWSLAAYDVESRARRTVTDMAPGTYVLGARVSADGTQLVADVFDQQFRARVIDAATGAVKRDIADANPVYDASFLSDGRVMWLGEVDGRFQVFVEGVRVTDAPYATLAAREANGTIRFLDREGWSWNLAEVALPSGIVPVPTTASDAPLPALHAITGMDRGFWAGDHLFYPQIHTPTILYVSTGLPHAGFVLGGGDRLGLQRWSIAGYAQPVLPGLKNGHVRFGADIAYLNEMAAPWSVFAEASLLDWADPIDTDDPNVTVPEERRTRDAILSVQRTWRGSIVTALSGLYTDDFDDLETPARRYLGGPQLALSYAGEESTRYAGVRRALYLTAAAAFYPTGASTFASDITDVGGSIGGVVPLPFGKRHTFYLRARGRALLSDRDPRLLQLGGESGLITLLSADTETTAPPALDSRFPPNLRFVEPLRGYEDVAIQTDRAELIDASWRYPVIVDRGVAATARILPSSFFRELDLELFGAGALDAANDLHASAGFAITLRAALFREPLIITYQVARRLEDDHAYVQLVGIAPELAGF